MPRYPWRPGAALAQILNIPYPIVEADQQMSRQIQGHWVQFAKTGNPNGPWLATWPSYSVCNPVTLAYGAVFKKSET